MAKKTKEEWKTYQSVFDNFTYRVLDKLISQGHFEGIIGPVSTGKESNVFSAKTKTGLVALKIYRLETCDFNRMYEYIKYDPRFFGLKSQRRKVIFSWVQREYRNIMTARKLGIDVPRPLSFHFNVLVEEFIGEKLAAPKLKDSIPENIKQFFDKIFEYMKKLYDAGYVHGDLSQYNILNFNDRPIIIDLSTMTPSGNPHFEEYLVRDVRNVCNFGIKHGLKLDTEKVLEKIKKPKL